MPKTTEPTVGEELSAAVVHERHVVKHADCWRCEADERRERVNGDETAEDDD